MTYHTNVQNGLPAVQTTASRFMTIAGFSRARGSMTAYHVLNYTPSGVQMYALSTQSVGGGFSLEPSEADNNIAAFVSGNGFTEGPVAVSGWQVVALVIDFSNNRFRIYRNGLPIYTQNGLTNDGTTDTVWTLGGPGGSTGLTGYFGEDAAYSVPHDDAAVLANSNILKGKWGIL